jgi:hypothetical protein
VQQAQLSGWLERRLGVSLAAQAAVGGGCIHQAWALDLADGRRLFAKTNRLAALPLLQAEADGLAALAAVGSDLVLPGPIACEALDDRALLLMAWLPLAGAASGLGGPTRNRPDPDQAWGRFGAALADLDVERSPLKKQTANLVKLLAFIALGASVFLFVAFGVIRGDWLAAASCRVVSPLKLASRLRSNSGPSGGVGWVASQTDNSARERRW